MVSGKNQGCKWEDGKRKMRFYGYIYINMNKTGSKSSSRALWHMVLLLVLNIVFNPLLFAQNDVNFEHLTTEEGLSQNDVNCIYQDEKGFMWFGTHDGLNKYDGYGFTTYKPDPNRPSSIASNLIYSLDGDKAGNLWVGTTGNGLSFFNPNTERFVNFRANAAAEGSLTNNDVLCVYVDDQNRLWVGTNFGLNMLELDNDLANPKFNHFFSAPSPNLFAASFSINSVFVDAQKQIWVGTNAGLYKLFLNKNNEPTYQIVDGSYGLNRFPVRSITEDKSGRLVIGSLNGLYYQIDKNNKSGFERISRGGFEDVQFDNQGNLWAGTSNGIMLFKAMNGYGQLKLHRRYSIDLRNPRSLNKNLIKSVYKDQTGIIWIGTNGGGVNKFDPEQKQFRHFRKTLIPKSLSYNKIRSIFEDSDNNLWIGTEGGGLNLQLAGEDDGTYNHFTSFSSISKTFALAEIQRNERKILLIGSENFPSLYEMDITDLSDGQQPNAKPVSRIGSSVFSILKDSRNNVWVGTYKGGVYRWKHDGDIAYDTTNYRHDVENPNSVSNNIIRNIFEDSRGNVWFATGNGLNLLPSDQVESSTPKFIRFNNIPSDTTSLSHNYILSLFESKSGDIWIGTFGGGLNKLIIGEDLESSQFKAYSEADGLPNNVIKGILEDEYGNLWISTNKGLCRFDPISESFKNYDVNDGLQSNEFQELACYKRKDGEMLFGGINGFNAFYPVNIMDNSHHAETVIANFLIKNKPVKVDEEVNGRVLLENSIGKSNEIKLKYIENSFSFEFAALHYASPEKNNFAYRLLGFKDEWIYTNAKNRFATYTNLAPGSYTFEVMGSNNDGLWDESPASLGIIIIPPWWRTKWAYAFYALLIIGLLVAFRRFTIIRTTEKHQLVLEHLEKEKTDELQKMKLEFFTNISHEFRTPLTLINGPLDYLQKNDASMDSEVRMQQYKLMQKNSNYLIRLVNQLLDFRKIDQGKLKLYLNRMDIVNFIKEITGPFLFLANKKRINYNILAPNHSIPIWFDTDAMEKILNNLLSNAFKFTPENGDITVEILKSGNSSDLLGVVKLENDEKEHVIIRVKDTGNGIPADKLPYIFDRFYVDKARKKINKQGVGIGLTYTKSLVELHHGEISVESEVGVGTTVTVKLPTKKAEFNESEHKLNTIQPNQTNGHVPTHMDEEVDSDHLKEELIYDSEDIPVLLVIDDNADIRSFIKQGLDTKYKIIQAENGEQGLDMLKKFNPNMIICDIMMPVMDGLEFCKVVKSDEQTSHIPLILLTAKSTVDSELKGLGAGADDYLTKPFNMEILELKIGKIITRREELRKRYKLEMAIEPSEVTVTSTDEKFLKQAMAVIEEHMMDTDFSVEMLVKELGLSRSNLYLKLKELTGLSSSEFIRNVRLKRAVQLLKQSDLSVKEVMYMTGFNTASYFSKCFKKQFGMVPSDYVRQAHGIKDVS